MAEITIQGEPVITITSEGVVTLNRDGLARAERERPTEWPTQLGRHFKGLEDKLSESSKELLRLAGERDGEAAARVSLECRLHEVTERFDKGTTIILELTSERDSLASRLDKLHQDAARISESGLPEGAKFGVLWDHIKTARGVEKQESKS